MGNISVLYEHVDKLEGILYGKVRDQGYRDKILPPCVFGNGIESRQQSSVWRLTYLRKFAFYSSEIPMTKA